MTAVLPPCQHPLLYLFPEDAPVGVLGCDGWGGAVAVAMAACMAAVKAAVMAVIVAAVMAAVKAAAMVAVMAAAVMAAVMATVTAAICAWHASAVYARLLLKQEILNIYIYIYIYSKPDAVYQNEN